MTPRSNQERAVIGKPTMCGKESNQGISVTQELPSMRVYDYLLCWPDNWTLSAILLNPDSQGQPIPI